VPLKLRLKQWVPENGVVQTPVRFIVIFSNSSWPVGRG
jgi:hypothetical protein